MSLRDDPIARDILERAYSAASEADRALLRQRIAERSADEQPKWEALLSEVDALRNQMNDVPMPAGLESRLLLAIGADAIPHSTTQPQGSMRITTNADRAASSDVSKWRRFVAPSTWKSIAAVLLLAIGGLTIWMNWPESSQPQAMKMLDKQIAASLATLAIESHQSEPKLELVSDDATKVLDGMRAHKLPFTPQMIHPKTDMKLLGEGVVQLKGKPAVFTRWQTPASDGKKSATYTLYQFDGKSLGLPEVFLRTTYPAGNVNSPHVEIWSGEQGCDWIFVADTDFTTNPFCGAGY